MATAKKKAGAKKGPKGNGQKIIGGKDKNPLGAKTKKSG